MKYKNKIRIKELTQERDFYRNSCDKLLLSQESFKRALDKCEAITKDNLLSFGFEPADDDYSLRFDIDDNTWIQWSLKAFYLFSYIKPFSFNMMIQGNVETMHELEILVKILKPNKK